MNHPVHPEAVADLQELLALCSLKFDRLAFQEMDTPGFASCCEEFSSLVYKALNLGTVPPDVANAIERGCGGWKEPGVLLVNQNSRFGMIESLIGYWRWNRLRTDEDDECSPFVWMLTAGTIAETSLGGLFEPVCESGEGPDFDEDTEDLRAWPEVCRRYALAARLLGRSLVGSPSRGLDPLFHARAGKLLESQDNARADAIDLKSNVANNSAARASKRDPLEYFESELSMHPHLVYLAYRCAFLDEDIDTSEKRMKEKFGKNVRYVLARSPRDKLTWPADAATRFSHLMRSWGVREKTGGQHKWILHPGVRDRVREIAKEYHWEMPANASET